MRLKLDENLPVTAAPLLRARGHDVDTVRDEGLTGQPDDAVWRAVQSESRFLVTQDWASPTRASSRQGLTTASSRCRKPQHLTSTRSDRPLRKRPERCGAEDKAWYPYNDQRNGLRNDSNDDEYQAEQRRQKCGAAGSRRASPHEHCGLPEQRAQVTQEQLCTAPRSSQFVGSVNTVQCGDASGG
jgi:hypothetical protein